MPFLLQNGQPLLECHFADVSVSRVRALCRPVITLRGRVRPGLSQRKFPNRFRWTLHAKRATQQFPVRGSRESLDNGKPVRHLECRKSVKQSPVNVSHNQFVDKCIARRDQKRLQRRRARGLPYADNGGLSHGVVLNNEPLDLPRIDVDPADNFCVIRAAMVGNPPVVVDAHPIPRVEPTITPRGRFGPIPIARCDR